MTSASTGQKFDNIKINPVRLDADRGAIAEALCDTAKTFAHRGWALGGSGHMSVTLRRDPVRLLITPDGEDKSTLMPTDCQIIEANQAQDTWPEAQMHQLIVQHTAAGAVLHSQSPAAMAISDAWAGDGGIMLEGYDLLRQFTWGSRTDSRLWVPIVDHDPTSPCPARQVVAQLNDPRMPARFGLLMRRCGLVSWGNDLAEARRHAELFETLFATIVSRMILSRHGR